ncbi:MAG TPA: TonB-dependent receptor [bacterium]|nr:TonB-dependent receptor [bacterium]
MKRKIAGLGLVLIALVAIWLLWPREAPDHPGERGSWLGTLGWATPSATVRAPGSPPPPLPRHSASAANVSDGSSDTRSTPSSPSSAAGSRNAAHSASPPDAPLANDDVVAAFGSPGFVHVVAKYDGVAPTPKRIPVEADRFCARTPRTDETLLVGADGGIENVFVRVLHGPRVAPPATPVRVSQNGCMYRPRVVGAVTGQDLAIHSDDETTHNVHAYRGENSLFNRAEVKGQEIVKPTLGFVSDDGILTLKCDIHPWMTGYVIVTRNPFFAITGADGTNTLAVPPGTWTLEAWQETLGTTTAGVSVVAGKTTEVAFHFRPR